MNRLLETALRAADAAAEVHLRYFRTVGVEEAREKGRSDFVSRVDLEAQNAAVAVIRRAFPDHHILAEEEMGVGAGVIPGEGEGVWEAWAERTWPRDGGYLWIIDPLDGTTNYLHGHPMFCASVGVGRAGVMKAGAVVAPAFKQRWEGWQGGGARRNGEPISVSGVRELRKALVGTGFPFKEPELVPRYLDQLGRVLPASGGVRRGGSAAMDLCYLAEGILDAFWEEAYLSPWDTAAGLLILQEAGGMATRLDGTPTDLANGSILAANSAGLWEAMAELLAG